MNNYDGSWDPDFPPVTRFVDPEGCSAKPWKIMEAHPDYNAAKNNEDRPAALRLVHCFLNTPENHAQLKKLKDSYPAAFIVPVRAIEAGGKNRIPEVLAEYISRITGLDVDTGIVQSNRVHRTGNDEWYRFAFRPSFDGPVTTVRKYILVDDVFTHGGSFNELRLHIEKHGGKVVHAAAVSLGGHGDKLAPEPELMKSLVDKFGEDNLYSFMKEISLYDGNYKALTNPETFALRRTPSLDFARDRIFAARCQGRSSMGTESPQKPQTPQIIPFENNVKRGFRR